MTITKEELSKQLQEGTDKFEAQFNKCPDDIKKQLPEFIDILKKQSQIFHNISENFPKYSPTDDRNGIYNILSLDWQTIIICLQTIIRNAEWVIENPELGSIYDGFLRVFGIDMNQIKKFQKKIENLDPDCKKYFTYMDEIYNFYDSLDKLENIQEKLVKAERKEKERKKKFEEEHFLDTIDEQLQNQYIGKFAETIKEIMAKAAPGEIKTYTLDGFIDDQAHFLMMQGRYPILYMTKSIPYIPEGLMFKGKPINPNEEAFYSITVCGHLEVSFKGKYDILKELIDLIPEKTESAPEEIRINIPDWQRKGLTAKGLDMVLSSMKDFDWKK